MDAQEFLRDLQRDPEYRDQIVHVHEIPARRAAYAQPARPIHPLVQRALQFQGIKNLYTHQADAVNAIREGRDVVVVTGTASGKTLCYNLPVIETLLEDPDARALYLFPTKALARDQLGVLKRFAEHDPSLAECVRAATYDGDTPTGQRKKIREHARIILTNPDMLHQGFLPYHGKWLGFFRNLRFVVVDELHTYRGIFGSHVAGVIRRLRARTQYDAAAEPIFITCSATIANPTEHAERLIGKPVHLIDRDGSPRGRKHFVFWNPPAVERDTLHRRSANFEAQDLMGRLILRGCQTITFARARVAAELIFRYLRDRFDRERTDISRRIRAYRGGYLPNERREIEQQLFSGELLGVCTTNALELGIDIGSLDAAIVVGFPGTICSTWQQVGRAGRSSAESIAFLIAYNDPIDQYLMRHPEFFFSRPHEQAVIDPRNRSILIAQLKCLASELRVNSDNHALFGDNVWELCSELVRTDAEQSWQALSADRGFIYQDGTSTTPHHRLSLRNISDSTYVIQESTGDRTSVIGSVDAISAPELLYPEAVYLHEGNSYLVRELDKQAKLARVERADVDYYTQPVLSSSCRITETIECSEFRDGMRSFGGVDVTWQTVAFKKIKYYTLEVVGQTALDLEPQTISTQALWVQPPESHLAELRQIGHKPVEALIGVRNMMLAALPFLAMADRRDISGIVDTTQLESPAMFVYDRYPGGVGYARAGYDRLDELLNMCRTIVRECECTEGCPSCVGLANLRPPIHGDPDLTGGYAIPDKRAAHWLLERWLGSET